jgi:hypothetical protein
VSFADYLPSAVEVNRCIKSVAEGAHEAVLLAVHRPARISYRRVKSQDKTPSDEAALLEHVLSRNVASGSLVVPITGASGVGKSHLIRILDARLRNDPATNHHLIIRIPKSASLREVVKLILDPLPQTSYAAVKGAFQTALAEVHVESAAIHMLGHLEVALRCLAASLREQAVTDGGATQALKERLFHAQQLPLLLSDAVTSVHYRSNVLPRIVQRAVAGSGDAQILGTEGQFSTEDVRLPASIDLGQAAKPVSNYYRTGLLAREGHGLEVATEVLNSVVDEATRELFRLQDSLGGMTLQEVILEIRRLLLAEGRELILLVEDFAALTGIQDTLANVLIQEGVRDGVAQYATMRSVIAVTDGYLVSRETLATRAAREWIVESELATEQEILSLTRSLVASYLNAARWGQDALIARYATAPSAGANQRRWLPDYRIDDDDEVAEGLRAFGFENDIPLFPYNAAAIENLARGALTQGSTLIFNPRVIIDEVLRSVLLPARDAFAKAAFPHPGISWKEPSADVAQWIASFPGPDSLKARYRITMVVWGNNPRTRSDIRDLPSSIYKVFGLPPPDVSSVAPAPTPQITQSDSKPQGQTRAPDDVFLTAVEEQRQALERWSQDKVQLPQQIATLIRDQVAILLNERIDSNAERFLRCTLKATDISIPEAGGEGRVREDSIRVATSNADPDGTVRSELLAVLRIRAAKGQNDYPQYEDDLARSFNLMDRLLPLALTKLRDHNRRQLQLAVQAFSANSRLLGLPDRGKTIRGLSSFLSVSPPALEELPADLPHPLTEWRNIRQEAVEMRPRIRRLLIGTCGCFQGTGDTPNGVDIVRVLDTLQADLPAPDYRELEGADENERRHLASISETRLRARAKAVLELVSRFSDAVQSRLGIDFDKGDLVAALKDLAVAVAALGRWDSTNIGATVNEFNRLCEDFRSSALKESLEQVVAARAAEVDSTDSTDSLVTRVGRIRISPLLIAGRFLEISSKFAASAGAEVANLEKEVAGIDPVASAASVKAIFDRMYTALADLDLGAQDAVA